MYTDNHPQPHRSASWRGVLLEAAATVIAFAIVALATRVFCWSFFIPFHSRYAVGTILTIVMTKWLVLKNHR